VSVCSTGTSLASPFLCGLGVFAALDLIIFAKVFPGLLQAGHYFLLKRNKYIL